MGLTGACSDSQASGPQNPPGVPRFIISTDIATGLLDTHGARGSCSLDADPKAKYFNDASFTPQDIDDGLTVALALNLEAAGKLHVAAVVPTFGNATLPAEMLVANQIVRTLKQRPDLSVTPGANGPASQTFHASPIWFDEKPLPIAGSQGSFAMGCKNAGVNTMAGALQSSTSKVTILGIGPLTDVACLVLNFPELIPKIQQIVVLASQLEGESLKIDDKVVNDFNFRMDPTGASLLLGSREAWDVPIRLMTFNLTGQTSEQATSIHFTPETLTGPADPTAESERSLNWILAAIQPRNEYWAGIFGIPEGPFDQYTLSSVLWPELFKCEPAHAYVQECPYPAWSPDYEFDAEGKPVNPPYNAPDNPCVDHGPKSASLASVPAQLVVSLGGEDTGPFVRRPSGVSGNIPDLADEARPVTACVDFAGPGALDEFRRLLYAHTW